MAQNSNLVLYTAEYGDVAAALRDLDAIEGVHSRGLGSDILDMPAWRRCLQF